MIAAKSPYFQRGASGTRSRFAFWARSAIREEGGAIRRTDVPRLVIASVSRKADNSSPPSECEKHTIAIFFFTITPNTTCLSSKCFDTILNQIIDLKRYRPEGIKLKCCRIYREMKIPIDRIPVFETCYRREPVFSPFLHREDDRGNENHASIQTATLQPTLEDSRY